MKKIIIANLKNNRIDNEYLDKISKIKSKNEIILLLNKDDIKKYSFNNIKIGSQNIIDSKYEYVLLGHKDVRYNKTDSIINKELKEALSKNIKVILCVNSYSTLMKDLEGIDNYHNIIIAYEDDSYIGKSEILSLDKIKVFIKKAKELTNNEAKVIYGGGIRLDNVSNLKQINNLDGIIIGKDYINIEKYIDIYLN